MRFYTIDEDQYLSNNYLNQTLTQMAVQLNRSIGSIYGRLLKLNLIVPDDIKHERKLTGLREGWKNQDTRFQKGATPWNKGKKGLQIGGVATQFKKGNEPKNTKQNGVITTRWDKTKRPYKFIRISKGHWEEYHRYLWEHNFGKLKPTDVVRFKDGNTLNCVIENLELVSRQQHMVLNSFMRYPEEVRDIIRVKAVLTRHINKQKNK